MTLDSFDRRVVSGDALDAATLYAVLRLRAQAFIVEQQSVYLDLDGRDLLASTSHHLLLRAGHLVSYLRALPHPEGGTEVGRVVVTPDLRRNGIGAQVVMEAIATAAPPIRINAQGHLELWYEHLGFRRTESGHDEDGIRHVRMALP